MSSVQYTVHSTTCTSSSTRYTVVGCRNLDATTVGYHDHHFKRLFQRCNTPRRPLSAHCFTHRRRLSRMSSYGYGSQSVPSSRSTVRPYHVFLPLSSLQNATASYNRLHTCKIPVCRPTTTLHTPRTSVGIATQLTHELSYVQRRESAVRQADAIAAQDQDNPQTRAKLRGSGNLSQILNPRICSRETARRISGVPLPACVDVVDISRHQHSLFHG